MHYSRIPNADAEREREDGKGSRRKIKRVNKACANCGSDEVTDGEVTGGKLTCRCLPTCGSFAGHMEGR